jgi:hypothetical protein
VESSGTRWSSSSKLSMRHTERASLERTPAEVATTLMSMFRVVLEPIFAVKNQL